jgi:MFS family permease
MSDAPPGAPDYRRLFAAYATALLGTGVAVVGLTLLAFDLAGDDAGVVVAAALSIKVAAYVLVAPLAAALTGRAPKKPLLVGLDLVRAAAILALPFATELWQLYLAVFAFAAAAAAFTPAYQALVPVLLPDPHDYARALSKSRIASELENGVSPVVAAAIILALGERGLFVAAMAAFLASAAFVASARLPAPPAAPPGTLLRKFALGPRLLFGRPGLRGLAPLHLAASTGAAMVMVNTTVVVQGALELGASAVALAFAAFGLGSVAGALAVPGLIARRGERATMLAGAALTAAALAAGLAVDGYAGLLAVWGAVGLGAAVALTPAPFLVRRLTPPADRVAAYAALFALANATLLVAYPLAGWLGDALAPPAALAVAGALAAAAGLAAAATLPGDATAPAD